MSLIPGIRLGPYEILAPIGVGGMGEVYSATDTRLRRTVAIKVLLAAKVVDVERKRRFLHEARAASALNHPNIVTLHDIANDGEANYLVMEFVPGTSLDKLITAKRLSLVEMIGYATQIASALAAAHAAGIVHRDIKPANVIVTPESQVKVLDFGLAKLVERAAPGPEGETQTKESALTEAGTVMGTVAYMSPEQASARPVDHRTDIFSLGVLLYEMLAGRRPFVGRSQVETMHAIINASVSPLSAQPPELQEILDKALAKNPNDRYQHAGDFELDLRRLRHGMETHSLPSLRTGVDPEGGRRQPLWWATAIGLIVLGIVAGWLTRGASQTQENPLANAHFARLTDFRPPSTAPRFLPTANLSPFCLIEKGGLTCGSVR
jgi:serine/threonine protein kinase